MTVKISVAAAQAEGSALATYIGANPTLEIRTGDKPATPETAATGTLDAGAYATEIELTRGTDKVTAPTEGYYTVKVECDLDGA